MSRDFFNVTGWFLLLVTLGCFADKKKWTFTFPQSIEAVKHSDVEIPCTFTAPAGYGEVRLVWYEYSVIGYPIVYSEDPSKVNQEYRGRTSLINGTDSCSLRIRDVTHTEWYYPGISDKINSFHLNEENTKKTVQVRVPGCSVNSSCKYWGFTFPRSIEVLKGSCVEIPCKLSYPDNAQSFTLFWYKNAVIGYPKIFNNRTSTDVEPKYKGRTFLVRSSMDSCSLRINNVQESEEIYPGINKEINSYHLHNGRFCRVSIIETPPLPLITGTEKVTENEPVNITCSVNHTCASSPPSITWNKHDLEVTMSHKAMNRGIWKMESTINYFPSYRDDQRLLECKVTFPNRKISMQSVTLDIKYKPKNVTISVIDNPSKEGDNVTLECTSQANPASETQYTWYEVGKTKTLLGKSMFITVRNSTSEKYICSARNDIGTNNSSVFSFINQHAAENVKHENILLIGGAAGFIAIALIILVISFCILERRKRTSAHGEKKSTQANVKKTEQIQMDNILYGNVSYDYASEQNSPRSRRKRTSAHGEMKRMEGNFKKTEQILMDNTLYGNVSYDDASEQNSPRSRQKDDKGQEINNSQNKEKKTEDSIVYTSVMLDPPTHTPIALRNTEEIEYAELNI
ncbi:nectin-1-like [Rhinoderma darwinii]|uniref:nectin-1-like n=1 Tax=Rhinoderma darwinii TaxID=43563 RepID=UPI003F66CD5A